MKTLLRLYAAAVLATAVTACGEIPTAAKTEVAPVRLNGGGIIGGGSRLLDGDTANVTNVSNDATATDGICNGTDERGGGIIGGGSYTAPLPCA